MVDVLSVDAIDAVDFLSLSPPDDKWDEEDKIFCVLFFILDTSSNGAAFNKCVRSCDALC